jgi:hypothetical protein
MKNKNIFSIPFKYFINFLTFPKDYFFENLQNHALAIQSMRTESEACRADIMTKAIPLIRNFINCPNRGGIYIKKKTKLINAT